MPDSTTVTFTNGSQEVNVSGTFGTYVHTLKRPPIKNDGTLDEPLSKIGFLYKAPRFISAKSAKSGGSSRKPKKNFGGRRGKGKSKKNGSMRKSKC